MYDDGVGNEFEEAHQKGLTRGFDLGWSYKGRFDRQLIRDEIENLEILENPKNNHTINVLKRLERSLKDHKNNREFITH